MDVTDKRPRVSVIMPSYNVGEYVEKCIKSVTDQTVSDIEIICVDAGSEDGTYEILKRYAAADPRIKLLTSDVKSYGHQMNIGLDNATGQYISIVETDDYIAGNMFEQLLSLSDNGQADVIKGNFYDYYETQNGSGSSYINKERRNVKIIERPFSIYDEPEILWGHPSVWSALYKRTFINDNNIRFTEAPGGGWVDNPFFFETLCKARSIVWTPKGYYYYRKTNPNSSSNKQTDLTIPLKRMMENLDVLNRCDIKDEQVLKFAYKRALMYINGNLMENGYSQSEDKVRPYAQKMLKSLNRHVIDDSFSFDQQKLYNKFLSPLHINKPVSGKILIYNWCQFDINESGGVTIYIRNLIEEIIASRPDIQVYFISSGWAYDRSRYDCYVRATDNIFGERCRTFEIVNSPVPSPQVMLHNNPAQAFSSDELKKVFGTFLTDNGPFNAIHFNNIEGLSFDVFDLKDEYPDTKFIFSLHNYCPFCMTGFYFDRAAKKICAPDVSGNTCINCTNAEHAPDPIKELVKRSSYGHRRGALLPASEWNKRLGFTKFNDAAEEKEYSLFRKLAIESLNRNMDVILAVSKRVRDIAIENGFDKNKTRVSYIGTKVADYATQRSRSTVKDHFRICFLGSRYGVYEKGYQFLLNSLAKISPDDASGIDLVLTATDEIPKAMLNKLRHFHNVQIIHGYKPNELGRILSGVNLGIVPVLWEDNLPQIAIEMNAFGVPVLCSSFGGAKELCDSDLFCFEGGNEADFLDHLLHLYRNPEDLSEYWNHSVNLTTMKMHLKEYEEIVNIPKAGSITISLDDYGLLLNENAFLYKSLTNTYHSNPRIENSLSYKIGSAITYIPRKGKRIVQKLISSIRSGGR